MVQKRATRLRHRQIARVFSFNFIFIFLRKNKKLLKRKFSLESEFLFSLRRSTFDYRLYLLFLLLKILFKSERNWAYCKHFFSGKFIEFRNDSWRRLAKSLFKFQKKNYSNLIASAKFNFLFLLKKGIFSSSSLSIQKIARHLIGKYFCWFITSYR